MKQFENWNIQNPIRKVTYYDDERRKAWIAALDWVLNSVCSEQDGYRAHLIAEGIKKELNEG